MEAVLAAGDTLDILDTVEVLQQDIGDSQDMLEPAPVRMGYIQEAFLEHMQAVEDNQALACWELALGMVSLDFVQEL